MEGPVRSLERAMQYFHAGRHTDGEYCTMCGPNFCAMRLSRDIRREFAAEETTDEK